MEERTSDMLTQLDGILTRLEADAMGVASMADIAGTRLGDQVASLLPGARSVVSFAMEVYPEVLDLSTPSKMMGEVSARDLLSPHMDYLNGRLNRAIYELAKECRRSGFKALPMPAANYPTDQRYLTSVLSYKHAAEAAGLGTIGRHSLLVTPEFGPRVRLACLITDAELKPTPRLADDLCDGCNNCIKICPARALSEPRDGEPYAINKFACQAVRNGSGSCSECMRICTQGR